MRTPFIGLLLALLYGCQPNAAVLPDTTGPEPALSRIVRDSITSGTYLSIAIQADAATVYAAIQALQTTKGVTQLNIVSNNFADLTPLKERLPLYNYILLDQQVGSEAGVQILLEGQLVSKIVLNSGQPLPQWPLLISATSAVRVGDPAAVLYDKLLRIRSQKAYAHLFERISLLTKDLATAYDGGMSQSPQWYFGYVTGPRQMDQIQVHFQNGKVSKLYVDHYWPY